MSETLREQKDHAAQLFASGRLQQALDVYQHIAQVAPEDLTVRQKIAELFQRLAKPQEAIKSYETLALAWARQGLLLRAIAICKVILQLDASHRHTQQLLAEFYARRNMPQPRLSPAPLRNVEPPASDSTPLTLPNIPLFSQLGHEAFLAVLEQLTMRTFEPGETIVTEGEPGESMFAIVEGRVEVVRQLEGGQRRAVASVGPGDFFGEMALLAEGPRLASVMAAERTTVLELTRAQVELLVKRHPSVGEVLQAFHQERLLANVMRSNPLLSALSPLQREAASRAMLVHSVPAGQTLLVQGQPGQALSLVLRGRCRVTHRLPDGREHAYPPLREGHVFGELSLLMGMPATATVTAETPCTLLRLERDACERYILSQPGMRESLSRLMAQRLDRTARLASGQELHEGDQLV